MAIEKIFDRTNSTYLELDSNSTNDDTEITFIGSSISDLSNILNKNFTNLLQNFYGSVPPVKAFIGQKWIDEQFIEYFWDGFNWRQSSDEFVYSSQLFCIDELTSSEFVFDQTIFNYTIDNLILFDSEMEDIKFSIDSFDSKKIILKQSVNAPIYIAVYHPKDKISNPRINKKITFITESGQTQFDIETIMDGTNINTLSVVLNGYILKNSEFSIFNNVLTINGMIYRIKKNDILEIFSKGASLKNYYGSINIFFIGESDKVRINKKLFQSIESISFYNGNDGINPIDLIETDNYFEYAFLKKYSLKCDLVVKYI